MTVENKIYTGEQRLFWLWAICVFHTLREMATSLRLEDRLDGAGNFVPWKARIVLILEKNEQWDEVVHSMQANPIQVPASTDAQALATFKKKDIKGR